MKVLSLSLRLIKKVHTTQFTRNGKVQRERERVVKLFGKMGLGRAQ